MIYIESKEFVNDFNNYLLIDKKHLNDKGNKALNEFIKEKIK